MKSFAIIFLLIYIVNCKQVTKSNIVIERPVSPLQFKKIDTTYFVFNSIHRSIASPSSELAKKISGFNDMNTRHTISKLGKLRKETSIVYNSILNKSELCFSAKNCYKVKDLTSFKKSIHSINYALVQFQKANKHDITKNVEIEEIVFYSDSNAKILLDYIRHIRSIEYMWNSLDKSPSYMYVEENKLYFIRMKNKYLVNWPKALANMMK